MAALGRLLALEAALTKDMCFDYVFSDTSLDLQYFSINATVGADTVLMVMSLDKSDFEGTPQPQSTTADTTEEINDAEIESLPMKIDVKHLLLETRMLITSERICSSNSAQ